METFGNSRIAGIGAYLPKTRVTSDELMAEVNCKRFGIPEDYISRHIGIIERRVADADQQPSDLATLASESALRDAGATPDEIDLIIYTGITRDCEEPSTAHFVQNQLGAVNAVCLDVSNACLGFMTGLSIADAYLYKGSVDTILICTGETPSKLIPEVMAALQKTPEKAIFKSQVGFLTAGDAGGAVLIRRSDTADVGLSWLTFVSRGRYANLCYYKRKRRSFEGQMVMGGISTAMIELNREVIQNTFKMLRWPEHTIAKLYCHQVGRKPHQLLANLAGQSLNNAPITYDKYGNLTSATIPVNMHLHAPNRGERLLLFGAGSGLSICHAGVVF